MKLYQVDTSPSELEAIIQYFSDWKDLQFLVTRHDGRHFVSKLYYEKRHGLYVDDCFGKTILKMDEIRFLWQLP